jgi:LPPG:FO 2-phospho-L-lactate transferase
MKVTALAGGVGGAKLLRGLASVVDDLTTIVNTGDDAEIYGVHVSPDVDIVTYWLAGIADTERGWGIEGDTFTVVEAIGALGVDNWFSLGDRDFATCLLRSERMRDGESLSAVTDDIRRALGVETQILPMSDDPVRTQLVTSDGDTLEFQEYFVKLRQQPEIVEVRFAGISGAKPAPRVLDAIRKADQVIICPSNPYLSIGPILALPEVRDSLRDHPAVTAVTPIVAGAALKGPADRLLSAMGVEVGAFGVAGMYSDLADTFVVDEVDAAEAERVEGLGLRALVVDTIMTDAVASKRLARALL